MPAFKYYSEGHEVFKDAEQEALFRATVEAVHTTLGIMYSGSLVDIGILRSIMITVLLKIDRDTLEKGEITPSEGLINMLMRVVHDLQEARDKVLQGGVVPKIH